MLEKFPIDNGRGGKPKEDAVSAAHGPGTDGAPTQRRRPRPAARCAAAALPKAAARRAQPPAPA
jgi:hypothetical protein